LYWNFCIRAGAISCWYLVFKVGIYFAPFLQLAAALLAATDLAFCADLVTYAGSLAALGANYLYLGSVNGGFNLDDAAFLALTTRCLVLGSNVYAFNYDLLALYVYTQNLTGLALVLAGQDYNSIIGSNLH
jgi:hypothetical protein